MNNQRVSGGSLFTLGDIPADTLPHFLQILRRHKSKRRLSQIVEAIFDLCDESEDGFVDRDTLCDQVDITRPGLLANLKKLHDLGMLSKSSIRPDEKRRSVVMYTLAMPEVVHSTDDQTLDLFDGQVVDIGEAEAAKLDEFNAINRLINQPNSVTCQHSDPDKTTFKGERLSVFTLAPALNVGRQEVTKKTTRVWRGRRSFEVTIRALTGHRIPNVQDLRPLVVAWTLARDQLPHMGDQAPSHPVFVMTLTDICRHLGFRQPNANNKRQTFNRLRRFRSSEWQLTDDRYNVLRTLRQGGLLERDKYMSFIADLEVVSSVGARGKTPEVISIVFHPAFTPVLTDVERSLTLHKEFIQGKYREFDQLIYQWCRTTVQHNHDPTEYALDRVHREAHPSVSFSQFRSGLERMASDSRYEQLTDNDYPMLLIPGYLLSFDFRVNRLVASARSDDRHLGVSSKYALANQDSPKKAVGAGGAAPKPRAKPTQNPQQNLPSMIPQDEHLRLLQTPLTDQSQESWDEAIKELETELDEEFFRMWIRPLAGILIPGKAIVGAPNRYVVDRLEADVVDRLQTILRDMTSDPSLEVRLIVASRDDILRLVQASLDEQS